MVLNRLLQRWQFKSCSTFSNRTLGRQFVRGYKAAVLKSLGSPVVVEDMKTTSKLEPDEVKIKVFNCGVNSSDITACSGESDMNPKLPFVPGFEVAGEVIAIGKKVDNLKVGDRVVAMNKDRFGGFAEEMTALKKDTWRLPSEIKYQLAASLLDCYVTAYVGLVRRAKIKENDVVIVSAAAGGLGLAAVDLAANVYKAKVIGICSTDDRASLVREKGAWAALKFDKKELQKRVNEVSKGKGASVLFDAVGGDVFVECLECVGHEGTAIVAGFASKKIPTIPTSILLPNSCSLIGVSLTHYRLSANEVYRDAVEEVLEMAEEKLIEPHISAKFKLDQVNEAFKFITDMKSTGKVVLELD